MVFKNLGLDLFLEGFFNLRDVFICVIILNTHKYMKNFKRGFSSVILLALLALVIISGGIYVQNNQENKSLTNVKTSKSDKTDVLDKSDKAVTPNQNIDNKTGTSTVDQTKTTDSQIDTKIDAKIDTKKDSTDKPIIKSIYPLSGPVGTVVSLSGTNLAGFEGDLDAYIENSKGEVALLMGIGATPREDKTIRVKIDEKVCITNEKYSGRLCKSYMQITPGKYYLYTSPWGKMSNKVMFTVTSSDSINK